MAFIINISDIRTREQQLFNLTDVGQDDLLFEEIMAHNATIVISKQLYI